MQLRRIRFNYKGTPDEGCETDGMAIDFYPADPRVNCLFKAAADSFVAPLNFAQRSGRLSEERATEALAKAYAEGVVAGSPCPQFDGYTTRDWAHWLVKHPDEFEDLRAVAIPEDLRGEGPGDTLTATG